MGQAGLDGGLAHTDNALGQRSVLVGFAGAALVGSGLWARPPPPQRGARASPRLRDGGSMLRRNSCPVLV